MRLWVMPWLATSLPCLRSTFSQESPQLLDLVGDRLGGLAEPRVGLGHAVGPDLALEAAADVAGPRADRPDRVREVGVAERLELVAQRLEDRERDERAHDVVGALEDREDPDVAQDLLVGLAAQVAGAALELHRAVGLVPDELGPGDLADRRLDRVVLDPGVDEAGGQVGHRLQAEQVGDHPADLVLDHLEVGQRLAELLALLDVVDRQVDEALGQPDRAGPQADAAVVEDLHRDVEALARLAEHVLGRDAHVLEVERAEVVAAQAHRLVGLAGLEALHPLLEDQRDVRVLAVDLRAREGREHVAATRRCRCSASRR